MTETRSLIPHSRPTLPTAGEWTDVVARLAPGWAADGPRVREFETAAAHWFGAEQGVAVNSGSSALQLALMAAGVREGSRVAVPAYCCAALLNSISAAGGEPLLVDAEPGGYQLSPESLAAHWDDDIAAIVVVHLFGDPVDVTPFRQFGVPIIEDCAQSVGARLADQYCGAQGDYAIGSFYATKVFTTGHGGLVTSARRDALRAVTELTDYDNRDDWRPRFSMGMSEIQAALGLWQLERLPGFLARRREIAHYYTERVVGELGLGVVQPASQGRTPIHYRFIMRALDADVAFRALRERGVDAKRPVYRPLHHYLGGDFPHAQAAHDQIVSLPIYPGLTDQEVEAVAEVIVALQAHWL